VSAHASDIVPHIPLDTSAEAHDVQRRIYAGLSGRERVAIAFRLSQVRQACARLCLGDALVRTVWPARDLVDP
jgi:hypothetical protein